MRKLLLLGILASGLLAQTQSTFVTSGAGGGSGGGLTATTCAVSGSGTSTLTFTVTGTSSNFYCPAMLTANASSVLFSGTFPANATIYFILTQGSGGPYTIAAPSGFSTWPVGGAIQSSGVVSVLSYATTNTGFTWNPAPGTTAQFGQYGTSSTPGNNPLANSDFCWYTSAGYQCINTSGVQYGMLPISNTVTTLTDGSTVTWAIASVLNSVASLTFTTHGGSRTLNITNPVIGGNYILKLTQDGTGGEGLTLGTGCTWKVANNGSGAVTLTSAANALDTLVFVYDGTNCLTNLLPHLN